MKIMRNLLNGLIRVTEFTPIRGVVNAVGNNKSGAPKEVVVEAVARAVERHYDAHHIEATLAAKQARVYQKIFFRQKLKSLQEKIGEGEAATSGGTAYVELIAYFKRLNRELGELGSDEEVIGYLARYYADDMACVLSPGFYYSFMEIAKRLFSRMAAAMKVHEESPGTIGRVKKLMGREPVILVPNHISNADHIPACLAIYRFGGKQPKIAAGANLFRGVSAEIMPRMNAYKIRREQIGEETRWPLNVRWFQNPVYRRVHTEYLRYLWDNDEPMMFYIEGTRSRDGKLGKPKTGILRDLYDYVRSTGRTAHLVPVSLSYSIVPEDEEIEASRQGKQISKKDLIAQLMGLDKQYGRLAGAAINIRFSDPLELTPETSSLDELVDRVMAKIGDGLVPTYTSIVARATLAVAVKERGEKSAEKARILTECRDRYGWIEEKHEKFERGVASALENFTVRGFVEGTDGDGTLHVLNEHMLVQYANRLADS